MGNVIGKGVHTLYPQVQAIANGHLLDEDSPSVPARKAEKELRKTGMALNLIKVVRVEGALGRGRVATKPLVSIAGNGQVRFNTLATKHISTMKYLVVNGEGRKFQFIGLPSLPKGFEEKDVVTIKTKNKDGKEITNFFFSFGGMLAELKYDYKASGNQVFDAATETVKIGKDSYPAVTFTLPEGSLTARPVVARKKKVSTIAPTPEQKTEQAKVAAAATAADQEELGGLEL